MSTQLILVLLLGFMCLFLLCYIVYSDHQHELERKDMYSRLMAKDLPEYDSHVRSDLPKSRNIVKRGLKDNIDQMIRNAGGG